MIKRKFHYIFIIIIFLSFLLINISCKKSDKSELSSDTTYTQTLIKGTNVRKNGFLSIKTGKIENVQESIKALSDEYNAQILEESTSVDSDSSLTISYKIKVKAEFFSLLIDRISILGKLIDLRIEAEDISDEITRQSDKIDLLTSRLNDAKKSNNTKLTDSLQAKLNEAKNEKAENQKSILYSYIHLTVIETAKLSHAFSLGFYYGKEGFVWMIKILLIVLIACIPLIFVIIIFKLILALFKYRWNKLMKYIENLGKGKNS